MSDAERFGVTEHGRVQPTVFGAQYREISQGVAPDGLKGDLAAVDERRDPSSTPPPARSPDDVRGGQQKAVRAEHDAAAGADRNLRSISTPADEPQIRDRRSDSLNNA